MKPAWIAVLCLGIVGIAGAAHAQAPADAAKTTARARYDEGKKHYNLGDYQDAIASFKEAYRIYPDPTYLYNVAQSYRQLGDCERALGAYRSFLREATDLTAEQRGKTEELAAKMEACVKEGKSVSSEAEETTETETGSGTGTGTETETGTGSGSETGTGTGSGSGTGTGSTTTTPTPTTTTTTVRTTEGGSAGMRIGGLVGVGVGVVAAGVGGYMFVRAGSLSDDVNRDFVDGGGIWTDDLETKEQDALRAEKLGTILTIGGGVAAIGGAVLWYLGRGDDERPAVTVLPRSGGATVSWGCDF